MAKFRHVCPALGTIQALNSRDLSTDLPALVAGVSAAVAGSVLTAPATAPNRGVIGRTGMPDKKGPVLVAERQFSHRTGLAGWTPRASTRIATCGPCRRAARAVA
jgi:hypothetical protein